jgi:IS5 family transposase
VPLLDRLSFQRFVALRNSSQVPNCTMNWTFNERRIQVGAGESIFDAVNRQLSNNRYSSPCKSFIAAYAD